MTEQQIRFFASAPNSCSYLDKRESVSLFADPEMPMTPALYGHLISHGFRRSGEYVYRPYCPECEACIPARIVASDFKPNKTQRRVWRKNLDIEVTSVGKHVSEEQFELYQRYIQSRHAGGGMDDPALSRYKNFIISRWCKTDSFEFRLNGQLVAVAVTDVVADGLSAFYTYFDPDMPERSLGVYGVLWQIEETLRQGKSWLYLGYWIKECIKMSYKAKYRPMQIYRDYQWFDLSDTMIESSRQL
ncbi:MAG: arginyltransferase [Gammaproteobacteria bacterium]|nr:arginyltransferase [Gammaproteobacteria bacterium]